MRGTGWWIDVPPTHGPGVSYSGLTFRTLNKFQLLINADKIGSAAVGEHISIGTQRRAMNRSNAAKKTSVDMSVTTSEWTVLTLSTTETNKCIQ